MHELRMSGQSIKRIEQLFNNLDTISSENKKIDLYNQLSAEYIKRNTDTFFIFYSKAVNLSKKTDYQKGLAEAYNNRADLCFYLDSFQLALIFNDLSNSIYSSLNDTLKLAQLCFSRGKIYYYMANYDSSFSYYKKSYDLAKAIRDTAQMAIYLKQVGKMNWIKGELTEALKNYEQSLEYANKTNNVRLKCLLYNNIGTIFYAVGDYEEALKYYYIALPLRDTIKDYKGKSVTLNNIGMVFSEWGKHDEAYKYYSHAASLSDSLDYYYGEAYSYYNLGNHLLNYNIMDSAILYFKKALITYKKDNNNVIGRYICYSKLGKIFQKLNEVDSAFWYFKTSLMVAERIKIYNYKASAYSNIANLFLMQNNIDSALKYAFMANNYLSKTSGFKKMKQINYQLLSDIYNKKKNYKKALEYSLLSGSYKDSIFNEESTKQITRMEVLYRIEQKENENKYLKREQERQKAKLAADRLTIRLQNYLFAVVSLLLLTLIGFTIVFYREKQKLKEANNTKNKLFSIISHDLRGPMGNFKGLIDLLLLDFANNDREKMNSLLKMMQKTAGLNYDLLENLLSWSRTESGRLNFQAEKIKPYFLVEAIFEHYDYSAATKSITLINNIDEDLCIYADEYMINTILRNLISNAIKFTGTNGKIIVKSKSINKFVEISVEDSGTGMPSEIVEKIFSKDKFVTTRGTAKEKGTGLGLKLCKDFVDKHNGKIYIDSQINKGTKISFTISKCDNI
ncbi:MAG: tetratricopeptide repeat-containing sensor histidine kinase [Bacteroidales bacterium]|nr:tetratricopeptide repeat-containing sensor histidine kinase [Bacteroidales bacterium]